MTDPEVSVVIPTFNRATFVVDAARSALAQTHLPLEVIVVNDGSTDDTLEQLEQLAGRVTVLTQRNQGVAAARNAGVRIARGTLIAFLDSDDLWLPQKLERQVERYLVAPSSIGLIHCGLALVDSELRPLEEHLEGLEGRAADRMLLGQGSALHASGSTMVLTAAALERVGGFDERLPPSEDWDMTFRVASELDLAFVAEPLVRYRQHGGNAHRVIPRVERAMMLAFDKAFTDPPPEREHLQRRAYANLHATLAGSYWRAGAPRDFARHARRALLFDPRTAPRFAGMPVRRARRAWAARGEARGS